MGTASVLRLREAQKSGVLQQSLFVDDLAVAVAALLLMIPGLLSDFFAVVVLIGPLRRFLARLFLGKVVSQADASGWYASSMPGDDSKFQSSEILEGDYQDISPDSKRRHVIDKSEDDIDVGKPRNNRPPVIGDLLRHLLYLAILLLRAYAHATSRARHLVQSCLPDLCPLGSRLRPMAL